MFISCKTHNKMKRLNRNDVFDYYKPNNEMKH
jgi:hypothetical protein